MNQVPVLEWAVAGFVFLGAVSMITQAIASIKTFRLIKQLKAELDPLLPKTRETLDQAILTLADSRQRIHQISERTLEVLDQSKVQLARLEEVVIDAAGRARSQLARTELIVEDAVTRVQEAVSAIQGVILRPIREVNGLAAAVKASLSQLLRGNPRHIDRVAQDEEMFI